jgi:hypothetical protein
MMFLYKLSFEGDSFLSPSCPNLEGDMKLFPSQTFFLPNEQLHIKVVSFDMKLSMSEGTA